MFKMVTGNPSFLRSAFESISELISEGTFVIDSNGINLLAMDPAGVSMVIFNILSSVFDDYEARETQITINIDSFIKS